MKANELMVGDWVTGKKWRENPFKLSRINDNGKYYYGITSNGTQVGPFLLEEIEPIPLNIEILEKNGFQWTARQNCMCITIKNTPISDLRCTSIHELQHALRLCGIKKEIEL